MNKILFLFLVYGYCTGFVLAEPVRLATTTSTENSGLLKVLIPYFEKHTGNTVHVLSFGTGQALRMGKEGDVDVVLVHAPKDEIRFVDAGYGLNRRSVMFNDFVIVGPSNDPANILGENNAGQGMGRVLQMANELRAYTITDRGTWLVMRSKLSLKLLAEGDIELYNPYSIIAVNPARFPSINYLGAMSLISWLTSVEGQNRIRNFRLEGQPLFIPTAIKN